MTLLTLFIIIWLLLVTILIFITVNRYIAYKERIGLAQLGYTPDIFRIEPVHRPVKRGVLWGGVITAMSGLGLLLGLSTLGMGVWILGGLIPLFVGIGMVLIYLFLNNQPGRAGDTTQAIAEFNDGTEPAGPGQSGNTTQVT